MSIPQIDAAIFDMDGTLLDTERMLHDEMLTQAAIEGLGDLEAVFLSIHGLRADLAAEKIEMHFGGHAAYRAFMLRVDQRLIARKQVGVPLKPHAIEVLEAIAALGLPMALATSSQTQWAEELLTRTALRRYFGHVIGGDQVTQAKPHPEIYLMAASALGIPPERCAAFEDSAPGTRAAHAAGCITVQIPDITPPDADLRALGHHIAEDLRQAAAHLQLHMVPS